MNVRMVGKSSIPDASIVINKDNVMCSIDAHLQFNSNE